MNLSQKLVVWSALVLFVAMGVYPPWLEIFDTTWARDVNREEVVRIGPRSGPYHWIFSPPEVPEWAWRIKKPLLSKITDDLRRGQLRQAIEKGMAALQAGKVTEDDLDAALERSKKPGLESTFGAFDLEQVYSVLKIPKCWNPRLDLERLLVQWVMVGVVALGLIQTLKRQPTV